MARRVGIELGPSHCRVVEVEAASGRKARGGGAAPSRVRTFASIPYGTTNPIGLASALRPLLKRRAFPRRASVALWGLRSSHQHLLLPPADPADLLEIARREARRTSPTAAPDPDPADGVLMSGGGPTASGQREVTYVNASAADVRARIQALVDAGMQIETLVTPAVALASVSRARAAVVPDTVVAYVAIEADVTCLSIVRNGVILFGREIPWGYASDRQIDRDQVSTKLSPELRRSFAFVKQSFRADVRQIVMTGGYGDLRTLTAPVMEATGVDVEVLDSLEGVDVTALPQPADEFREKVAELRMAWALAADAQSVNLLPREARTKSAARQEQLRIGAGAAAGFLIAAAIVLVITLLAAAAERNTQALRKQIATLEPQLRQLEQRRHQQLVSVARRAALDAFGSQGPRIARILEVLDRATPGDVVIKTLQVKPKGPSWQLVITGESRSANPADAQASFNQFLRAAEGSPLLGMPVKPPIIKVNSGEPGVDAVEDAERKADASHGVDLHGVGTGEAERLHATGASVPDAAPGDPAYEAWRRQVVETELVDQRRRIPFEEHWNRHPVKPLEYFRWLEQERQYNQGRGRGAVTTPTPGAKPPVEAPKPHAVLAFTVEFEVRK